MTASSIRNHIKDKFKDVIIDKSSELTGLFIKFM